ncbi:seed storage albumin 6 precursor [Artemisia annua]|uniref:Seed storage albumin 6 n=1 Tax=Artemisia annua TaxID=35608 RepID=A0A2U1NAA4_ARTAN|nr:seed storage albumin 6 precursor [Artemisia annua]
MANQIVLALAFAALVAFASAYSTIGTTTFDDENQYSPQRCTQRLQGQRFNQCQKYLQQGQSAFDKWWPFGQQSEQGVEQCCNELQRVDQQCQCAAVQQVYQKAQQMQGQQGGMFGGQKTRQLREKAQNLPNKCNLRVQSCPLPTVVATTITEDNRKSGSQSQQSCYQRIQGQRFQQCQNYIQEAQQSGSYGPLLMSTNKQGQQYQQEMQQCCNELERVETECQCEALQEVYRQAQKQQQPWSQQQGSRRGGQQGQQMQGLRSIVEKLRNQCNLQVQQCQIPSAMF